MILMRENYSVMMHASGYYITSAMRSLCSLTGQIDNSTVSCEHSVLLTAMGLKNKLQKWARNMSISGHFCRQNGAYVWRQQREDREERWEVTNLRTQQHYELHHWRAWLHTHQTCSTKTYSTVRSLYFFISDTHTASHKNIIKEDTVVSVVSAIVYSHHSQFYKKHATEKTGTNSREKKDEGGEKRGRDRSEQEMRRGWDQHRDSGSWKQDDRKQVGRGRNASHLEELHYCSSINVKIKHNLI